MNILAAFAPIKAFVLDVDGVLTDGSVLLLDDGQMARRMSTRDGYALQLAVKKGYHVLVISGGESAAVRQRLEKLGIRHVYLGVLNKAHILQEYTETHRLSVNEVLYMGDDLPDFDVMQLAGLPCCPQDAAPEIAAISQYISPRKGGEGCVRDVIEKVLKLNGHWHHDGHTASR
jgi:3-deoxy-D-manno-octulosonate 8-phosphate phosphatase (KDO 8-P phosphatase)